MLLPKINPCANGLAALVYAIMAVSDCIQLDKADIFGDKKTERQWESDLLGKALFVGVST